MGVAKALARLLKCADLSELSLLAHTIKTIVDYVMYCTYNLNESTRGDSPVLKHFWILRYDLASRFNNMQFTLIYQYTYVLHIFVSFCADCNMGRPKLTLKWNLPLHTF